MKINSCTSGLVFHTSFSEKTFNLDFICPFRCCFSTNVLQHHYNSYFHRNVRESFSTTLRSVFYSGLESVSDLPLLWFPLILPFGAACQSDLLHWRRIIVKRTSTVPPLPPSYSPVAPSFIQLYHPLHHPRSFQAASVVLGDTFCFSANLELPWKYPQLLSLHSVSHIVALFLKNPDSPLTIFYHLTSSVLSPCVLLDPGSLYKRGPGGRVPSSDSRVTSLWLFR